MREQHNYPMATYCQRAMVLLVEVYERIYAQADKETLLLMSKALRDMETEHVLPGSKPQQAERFALATSLIGHRIPKEDLKRAMSKPRPNQWQANTAKSDGQPTTTKPLPHPHPPPKGGKPKGANVGQQTDP